MAAKDVAPAVTLMSNGHYGMVPAAAVVTPGNGHRSSNSRSVMPPPAVTLSSGHRMPAVGLGVWRMEKADVRGLIHAAIREGYRHFDCAAKYQNEAEVGDALAEAFETGLVKREDLFITTKFSQILEIMSLKPLWNSDHGHVIEACKDSLKKLKLDYLDLYLVHFPVASRHTEVGRVASVIGEDGVLDIDTTVSLEATWHAMEDLVNMGLELAEKYGKTPAQLVLRWGLQKNAVVIPKTSKVERLQENLEVFDFNISDEDMEEIKAIDKNHRSNQPAKFWGIDVYS
ncbi:NADP-dependent D-sorbitol-6-phosphate dehydrogenase [Panicum miliaceum]|uniref:NADP-dependent D-sorbitol-6-phosphate dehydrogenase n=1 Tax=Panicum miliaceum TaxID=4540 RepID=A0A3L6RX68_PANMI|nr:NADP-dependent D-sorbitol-6-phosphate dehydrogenase [Panicum miliaceum]